MTQLKQIKAEVERLGRNWDGDKDATLFQADLREILSLIKSLEKEEPKGLDEAAEKYRKDSCNAAMKPNIDGPMPEYGGSVKDAFKSGAKWMAKQMKK